MAQEQKPVSIPLPPSPPTDFLSSSQWDTFFALLDGILPGITSESTQSGKKDSQSHIALPDDQFEKLLARASRSLLAPSDREQLQKFFLHRPFEEAAYRDDCQRTLAISPQRADLAKVLSLLDTRLGSRLLTGYWTPIARQPASVRESILKSWVASRFQTLNMLAKNMSNMALKSFCMTNSLFQETSGYTDIPKDRKPGQGYDYNFLQPSPNAGDVHQITTDVVIVGSGCGGGVAAKNIAEAGHRVLVVDKGYYFPPSALPMSQAAGTTYLYDHGGVYMSESASTAVMAGGAWGGGGTVNWSVSLRTQDYVREEWAGEGLKLFGTQDYDDCMDRVSEFMGVGTSAIKHNPAGRVILDGCKKLGWKAREAPQNTAGKLHYCGQCHLGCGSAEKRGPAVSWLPTAGDAGAQFMEGFRVDRVLFGPDGQTAVGVEGTWTSRDENGGVHTPLSERKQHKVVIKAKKVVISSGSLWSPLILNKSGIQNENLGQNLHLHPCSVVAAVHKEDIRAWEGGIITSVGTEFENLDEKGHGVKLETVCMVPYILLSNSLWSNAADAKLGLLKYRNTTGYIALTRDRDGGRVFADPETGEPRIHYDISDFDRAHTMEGIVALTKLAYVAGAIEIRVSLPGMEPFIAEDDGKAQRELPAGKDPEYTDPIFAKWLSRLRRANNKPPVASIGSAHQMGTCRMSTSPEKGVVDPAGQVWGRKNLYVSDASVFPSASGVNPMLTVMSISDHISRQICKGLAADSVG